MFRRSCFLVVFAAALIAVGADENKEKPEQLQLKNIGETCKAPFLTQNYKPDWEKTEGFNENSTIYFVLGNKAHFYRLTQQLYQSNEFDDLKETHLVNSCLRVTRDATGEYAMNVTGYNDKSFVNHLTPVFNSPYSYIFSPATFAIRYSGRLYVSLSDQKSFTLYTYCFDDGLGTFVVVSPYASLSSEALAIAKAHVKALGFKEEHFLELNNELACEPDTPLENLPVPKNLTLVASPPLFSSIVIVPGTVPRYTLPFHLSNTLFNFKK